MRFNSLLCLSLLAVCLCTHLRCLLQLLLQGFLAVLHVLQHHLPREAGGLSAGQCIWALCGRVKPERTTRGGNTFAQFGSLLSNKRKVLFIARSVPSQHLCTGDVATSHRALLNAGTELASKQCVMPKLILVGQSL